MRALHDDGLPILSSLYMRSSVAESLKYLMLEMIMEMVGDGIISPNTFKQVYSPKALSTKLTLQQILILRSLQELVETRLKIFHNKLFITNTILKCYDYICLNHSSLLPFAAFWG